MVVVMVSVRIFRRTFGLASGIAGSRAARRSRVSVTKVQIAVYAFPGETEVLVSLRGRVMLLLLVHLRLGMFLHRVYALTATTSAGVVVEAAVALGFKLVTLLFHLTTVGPVE